MSELENILQRKGTIVHRIPSSATVLDAVDELCRLHVGALVVEEKETPVGIVSERDVLTRVTLRRLDPAVTRVGDIMTKEVRCVDLDSSPEEAMRIMTE